MKNRILLVLCLLMVLPTWARSNKQQGVTPSKNEMKLYVLLNQNDLKKVKKKSEKLMRKDPKNIHANYAMATYYFRLSNDATRASRKKVYIANSLRYYKRVPVEKYAPFQDLSDSLHVALRQLSADSVLKPIINKQYRNWLLVYFNDSVPAFYVPISAPNVVKLDSADIGDSLRFVLLKSADKLAGVRYKYAGTSPKTGFDCSGFTQYVYQKAGMEIPHNAQMQSDLSKKRIGLDDLQPGDLVFFGSWSGQKQRTAHAGIVYAKNGDDITVIHCVSGGVSIEGKNSSWDRYWIDHVLFGISMNTLAQNNPIVEQ